MKNTCLTLIISCLSYWVMAQTNADVTLLQAIQSNDLPQVKALVTAGADVNVRDENRATTLIWAAYKADLEMVQYLVAQGADYTQKGVIYLNEEKTAYYGNLTGIAAGEGKLELLKYLIEELGIDVDDKEYNPEEDADTGWTAAQCADSRALGEVMAYLEKYNTDLSFLADTTRALEYDLQNGVIFHKTKAYQSSVILLKKVLPNIRETFGNYDTTIFMNIMIMIGLAYSNQGKFEEALPYYQEVKNITLNTAGNTHPRYGAGLIGLANLYQSMGRYSEAEPLYKEALPIIENTLGKDHLNYGASLSGLANLYRAMGHYGDAELLFKEALPIIENTLGKDHPTYGVYLNNLAILYEKMGRYSEAEPLSKEALQITRNNFGRAHPDYGKRLNNLALLYTNMSRYNEAELLFKEALPIIENTLGKDHPDYSTYLSNLAVLYDNMGRYSEAEPLYKEALQITKASLGKGHPQYGTLIYYKAKQYEFMGRYSEAEPLLKEALQITEKALGMNHPEYGRFLSNLAILYTAMGRYSEAEPLFKEALQITEKALGKKHPDYGTNLNFLADLYHKMARYIESGSLFKETLQVTETSLGKNHPLYGGTLYYMTELYQSMGRYSEAESLNKEALQIIEASLGKDHPNYGTGLIGLANLYQSMGRYSEAEPLYKEALQITEASLGKDHLNYGTALIGLANLYQSMGRYSDAESLYKEVLQNTKASLGIDHPNYGASLSGLSNLYRAMGRYGEAEPLFYEALPIIENTLGKDHPEYGTRLNNLALFYSDMGRYSEAEPLLKEALQITENTLSKDHHSFGTRLNNLAGLYVSMSRYSEAEPLLKEALQITENTLGKDHPEYGTLLNNLAVLYESTSRYSEAEPLLLKANEIIYYNLNQSFIGLSEKERKQYLQTVEFKFKSYHSFALRRKIANPSITTLSYNNTLINKGILLQSSVDMRQNIQLSGDSVLLQSYDQWMGFKNQLAKLYTLPLKERYVSTDSLENLANDLEKELNRGASVFRERTQALQVQWEDVKHSLSENEAAIEFISFQYRSDTAWTDSTLYVALVLRPEDEYPHMIELCTEAQLDSLFQGKNTNLAMQLYPSRGVEPVNSVQDKGALLYQLIWQPLDSLLAGIQTIYFSPSGLLHQIAFAALPYGKDSLLMDRYQLHQVSSTRVLVQENTPSPDESLSAALFGGIYYDTDTAELLALVDSVGLRSTFSSHIPEEAMRSNQLTYLPGTAKEVQNIAAQFNHQGVATQLFTGNTALEEQFIALGKGTSPNILHIATHGFFFPDVKDTLQRNELLAFFNEQQQVYRLTDDPLRRAGLLLAGANHAWMGETLPKGIEDGILTAYEVSQLNLSNTELVVLSACETGLGEVQGSEGVYGLQRAFKMAGAKNLMMSLWKVPDAQTVELMEKFYTHWLEEDQPIRTAFQQAQQEMQEKYDPYYWAAFVLVE